MGPYIFSWVWRSARAIYFTTWRPEPLRTHQVFDPGLREKRRTLSATKRTFETGKAIHTESSSNAGVCILKTLDTSKRDHCSDVCIQIITAESKPHALFQCGHRRTCPLGNENQK